ncbi:MAG: DUF1573 domain-containing protein [Bacteroidia bacterium]|jgi:hypothetical protein|nr:DUF1573 domain-containing protein [Bacteroidia bacterium]
MKASVILIVFSAWLSWGFGSYHTSGNEEKAVIHFDSTEISFGKTTSGKTITREFYFTNTGNIPLIISCVKASNSSCCASFDNVPVLPGHRGKIIASYSNQSHQGIKRFWFAVESNHYAGAVMLILSGEIITEK